MKIDGKFELNITGANNDSAAFHEEEMTTPIWCVAIGDAAGKLIPGTRLTKDVSLRECRDALMLLKEHHPNAGMFLGAVLDGRPVPPYRPHPNQLEITYFQVMHDEKVDSTTIRYRPLGQRWDTREGAEAELPKLRKLDQGAYVSYCTLLFNRLRDGDLERFTDLRATVRSAA
jgi:hypothetical protein